MFSGLIPTGREPPPENEAKVHLNTHQKLLSFSLNLDKVSNKVCQKQ